MGLRARLDSLTSNRSELESIINEGTSIVDSSRSDASKLISDARKESSKLSADLKANLSASLDKERSSNLNSLLREKDSVLIEMNSDCAELSDYLVSRLLQK